MILECPRCLHSREGDFSETNPPGKCPCKSFQPWRVVKQKRPPGFVRLLTDDGWKELYPPHYAEPNKHARKRRK